MRLRRPWGGVRASFRGNRKGETLRWGDGCYGWQRLRVLILSGVAWPSLMRCCLIVRRAWPLKADTALLNLWRRWLVTRRDMLQLIRKQLKRSWRRRLDLTGRFTSKQSSRSPRGGFRS